MLVPIDLHIHSCLSPCAEDEMTPNNLVNMAALAGIQILAVTDHNSTANLPACAVVAQQIGIALLPGVEVTTREEVHCLCYFATVDHAMAFGEALYEKLGDTPNAPQLFGNQTVLDEEDALVRIEPRLLIQATSLSLDALAALARTHGGLPVPAHINRSANGLLNALGFLPKTPRFAALEVSPTAPAPVCDLRGYHTLRSSDAHRLEALIAPTQHLELAQPTAADLFQLLQQWDAERP